MSRRRAGIPAGLGLALLAIAVPAAPSFAQACLGLATTGRQPFVESGVGRTDGSTGYTAGGGYDTAGPLTFQAGATFTDVEDTSIDVWGVGGVVAAELPLAAASICPLASLSYAQSEEVAFEDGEGDLDVDLLTTRFGLGLGKRLPLASGRAALVPYVQPALIVARLGVEDASDTQTEFGATLGATLAFGRVFGGPTVEWTTFEDSDPTYGAVLGLTF